MASDVLEIRYRSTCDDGNAFEFLICLDAKTLDHLFAPPVPSPAWTRLSVEQCVGCPLDPSRFARCPMALSLVEFVEKCGQMLSYSQVEAAVETPYRTVNKRTTAQRVVSSLLGLIMATSGCPHTTFLKPMARFHLPFATREETIFRSASAYLLAQYFMYHHGKPCDLELKGLQAAYARLQAVNAGMAQRMRHLSKGDANVNAISLLDLFAQDLPFAIEEKLAEIEYLFTPYFTANGD